MLVTASQLLSCRGDRFRVGDDEIDARPALKVAPRVPDVGLRQVEAERRQPRPYLLDEIKEAPGAAADVDQPQFALVASGESFRKRRQRLPPHGVGRSLEQHLDLRVVAVGGFLSQPAARLEMEILQVVVRAAAARLCVQHLARRVALATRVDLGEVAEE